MLECDCVIKIPICEGMSLVDIQLLRKYAKMYKKQHKAMEELKKASESISDKERKKLGW